MAIAWSLQSLQHCLRPTAQQPFPNQCNRRRTCIVRGASSTDAVVVSSGLKTLDQAITSNDGDAVKEAMVQLSEIGWAKRWNSYPSVSRRTTFMRELTTLGIKNAENLAIPSVRNDAAFLATVVGSTSIIAVLAGQLPGDWGFFVPYLVGSISLVVLAVGSVAPGLLQAAIDKFSSLFPDYQERIVRHEAAHFLGHVDVGFDDAETAGTPCVLSWRLYVCAVAYLLGVPIVGYSLDIGKEHVNLADGKLQKRLYSGELDDKELDRLAVVSMAGLAAEGLMYDKVIGQSADLFSLQRLMNRSKPRLGKEQQQNLTRWAVIFAASILKNNQNIYDALRSSMLQNLSVIKCIEAIEKAA